MNVNIVWKPKLRLVAGCILPLLCFMTARADIQMTSASGLQRRNLFLDVTPIKIVADVSLTQCLDLCKKNLCKSFNYGNKECSLLSNFYCESDITKKALKAKQGFTYYDVADDPDLERSADLLYSEKCTTKQECSTRCKECVTDGRKGVSAGTKCFFPFNYLGKVYNGCTEEKYAGNPWCSTAADYTKSTWGTCVPDCPTHQDV